MRPASYQRHVPRELPIVPTILTVWRMSESIGTT